jgi:hypothetical protein
VNLGGSAARAGGRFTSFHTPRSPTARAGRGAGAEAGTLRGYHRGRPGMERRTLGITAAELVPRCVDHSDRRRALERTPPCPGHAHLTYERARPARRVEPLRMQVACASYTHDREHSDGWPSYPGNPNAMPLSSTSIASSPSY